MENAFSDLNGLELFFLACSGIGGFFVLIKLISQFWAGDVDMDGNIDIHHPDSDVGFQFLSLHGFSSFLLMFGLVGIALYRQSQAGLLVSISGAVIAGGMAVWMIGKMFQWGFKLQSSGTLPTEHAVGCTGTVYLRIPEKGSGRVSINFRNRLREFDCIEKKGSELPSGTPVRVVEVRANILVVEKLN